MRVRGRRPPWKRIGSELGGGGGGGNGDESPKNLKCSRSEAAMATQTRSDVETGDCRERERGREGPFSFFFGKLARNAAWPKPSCWAFFFTWAFRLLGWLRTVPIFFGISSSEVS